MVEVIAICVFGVAALGVILFVIVKWANAAGGAADARVNDATKAGRIAILEADLKTQTERGNTEERRADALDKELDQVAADGDVAGARDRVLARWKRQAGPDPVPTGNGDPSPVPVVAPTTAPVDRDALEPPT